MTDNKPTDWLCQKLPTTFHPKAPRKKLLKSLLKEYNDQCDRLQILFDDIAKTGKRITFKSTMPKSARKNRAKEIRKVQEHDSDGYKRFLKEEGFDDLL